MTEPRRVHPAARTVPRRPEGPRRVRNGIKLKARDGLVRHDARSLAVLALFEEGAELLEREEGLRYAKIGQLRELEFAAGTIDAKVQDSRATPHQVRIRMPRFADAECERIVEAMADEARWLAALPEGELPEAADDLLASIGLRLVPERLGEGDVRCDCALGRGCRHVAAVGQIAAERVLHEPQLLLLLRGLPAGILAERLRQARALRSHGVVAAHVDPLIPESREDPVPLAATIDRFWRAGVELEEVEQAPPTKHLPHALLRRLGPSPLGGRFPMVGLLASIYDVVSAHTRRVRDEA